MSTATSDSSPRPAPPEPATERSREAIGLQIAIAAFVVAALFALAVFRLHAAPISGPGSIGQFAAIASAATAIIVFVAGRLLVGPGATGRFGPLDILDIAAFAFAHAVIALLGWTLVATILEAGLQGATVFPLPVLALSGAAAALTAYLTYFSATHLDLQLLATVLALFLVFGILTSMLTASDPLWWKENLSALGMTDDLSARTFNLTLIVAGILVTTLARYATRGLPTSHPRGAASVRACLIAVGVLLGLVGVFPVDRFFALHTAVASGMVVAYGILIVRIGRWIPDVSKTFRWLGVLFILVILVLAVFFATGYYTLTAVELVAGTLVFTWIILFIRTAEALRADAVPSPG